MGSKPNTSSYEMLCHSMQSHIVEVSDWRWEARVNIPPPSPHVRRRIDESAAFAASITPGLCAHVHRWRTHVTPAPPPHIIHLIPPDPSWLTPSPLTTVTAITALQKTIINSQQREGLLLGGPLEYKNKREKRNQNQVGLQIPAFQMFMFQVPDWQTSKQLFH